MLQQAKTLDSSRRVSGWAAVGLIALGFVALFLFNYWAPQEHGNYATRIWRWNELALAAGALVVVALRRRELQPKMAWIGAGLGLVSGASHLLHNPDVPSGVLEAAAIWLTFAAGSILFQTLDKNRVAAFDGSAARILRGVGVGLVLGVPLAGVNNLFFYLQEGAPRFINLFSAGAGALSPGIHEETVFRYFILAFCFTLLRNVRQQRAAWWAALTMAVIPHSIMHLPDLFLQNPVMALVMLAGTSLLFGLPMALLQLRRSFESAVAFHWFIDFVRFWMGY